MIISFILSAVVIFLDQVTKLLFYGKPATSIIGNLLWFKSALNTGIAFSMFEDSVPIFIVISSIACALFLFLIISNKIINSKAEKICLGIVLGGAFSNLIDRVIFKGVRDFIYLKFMNFAIFNIADMAVSFGAVIFCVFYMIREIREFQFEKINSKKEENINNEENPENQENKYKINDINNNDINENVEINNNQNMEETDIDKKENNEGNVKIDG